MKKSSGFSENVKNRNQVEISEKLFQDDFAFNEFGIEDENTNRTLNSLSEDDWDKLENSVLKNTSFSKESEKFGKAEICQGLALIAQERGNFKKAELLFLKALPLFVKDENTREVAYTHLNLSIIYGSTKAWKKNKKKIVRKKDV